MMGAIDRKLVDADDGVQPAATDDGSPYAPAHRAGWAVHGPAPHRPRRECAESGFRRGTTWRSCWPPQIPRTGKVAGHGLPRQRQFEGRALSLVMTSRMTIRRAEKGRVDVEVPTGDDQAVDDMRDSRRPARARAVATAADRQRGQRLRNSFAAARTRESASIRRRLRASSGNADPWLRHERTICRRWRCAQAGLASRPGADLCRHRPVIACSGSVSDFMALAFDEARRAGERGEVPVGAVVVEPSSRKVLAIGRQSHAKSSPIRPRTPKSSSCVKRAP